MKLRATGVNITPEMIPHAQFHTGAWLLSCERPGWYYFKKQQRRNVIRNKDFEESVDGPLRELVQFLHRKNIATTPSCSGHHIRERDFEQIYSQLKEDEKQINSAGLKMKDIESDRLFLFRNKDYKLPWSETEFLEKVIVYQQKGVLGMRLGNRKKIKESLLKLNIEDANFKEKDSILFVFTNESGRADIKQVWKEITQQVKQAFGQE